MRRGRSQTDELIDGLAGRVMREVDRARRVAGLAAFPIAELRRPDGRAGRSSASPASRPPDLRTVRDYERRNANRKSVLAAIERKLP